MNILQMKYAVKVASLGSLNRASEELLIAPPNLSRTIKEIETDLGITIFHRSSKGMKLTKEGENFVNHAKKILKQIEEVEQFCKGNVPEKKQFSISVPRASYIADAFVHFSQSIGREPVEIYYKETNQFRAIKNIFEAGYKLGIIRYASEYDKNFVKMFEEKKLIYKSILNFHYLLVMSSESPLAKKDKIHLSDLCNFIRIAHADCFVPSLPDSIVKKEELSDNLKRHIFVFERGSQFDLLAKNPETFMWVSSIPDEILERYNLVQRQCSDNTKEYKDVLIFRKNYKLSDLDIKFMMELNKSRHNCFL